MASFYGWSSSSSRLVPLRGDSLLTFFLASQYSLLDFQKELGKI